MFHPLPRPAQYHPRATSIEDCIAPSGEPLTPDGVEKDPDGETLAPSGIS